MYCDFKIRISDVLSHIDTVIAAIPNRQSYGLDKQLSIKIH